MKAIDKIRETAKFLEGSGIEAAEKEAEILIRHGLGMSTIEIYRDNPELTEKQIQTLEGVLNRRLIREPLQYILSFEHFLDLKILVHPGVLIPRPETEFMAEQAIKRFTVHGSRFTVLDLCTGSGCIALALAKEFPHYKIYGTDISEIAIECANKNAEINGIKNVTFLHGNLFEPFKYKNPPASPFCKGGDSPLLRGVRGVFPSLTKRGEGRFLKQAHQQFDLIISNPPYIKTDDIKNLQPEIKDWEPAKALDGGKDGLDFYREIIPSARRFLKDNGLIMLELGCGQSGEVTDILKSAGYLHIEIIKDYAGIERIIKATWKR